MHRVVLGTARILFAPALSAAVVAGALAASPAAAEQPRPDLTTCVWVGVGGAPPATNLLVADRDELVFFGNLVLPRGGTVRFRHRFPYARSITWSTYDPATTSPIDTLRDREIAPDAGSENPFVPGASRAVAEREYTMTVTNGRPPSSGRAPNTIYTNGRSFAAVSYRIYLPDRGRDRLGDTGLPDVSYRPARGGRTLTGTRACRALNGGRALNAPVYDGIFNAMRALAPLYRSLLALQPGAPTAPAVPEGRWDAFFNFVRLAEPYLRGTPLASQIRKLPAGRSGPAADWSSDSALAIDYVDRRLGPVADGHNALVVRGTLPRTPATLDGEPTLSADVDLRYWSLCIMPSIPISATHDCVLDEQVPVDAGRRYTIVVSTPADRPANATPECGVAWLSWGTREDGYDRPEAGLLTLRNQDPAPGFHQTIQAVARPGQEAAVMGDYLPTQEYVDPARFAAKGCPAAAE